jgi:hypothetical protein
VARLDAQFQQERGEAKLASAKQFVEEILELADRSDGKLIELRVTSSLWDALCKECAPLDPEEIYHVPFVIDDKPPVQH